MYWNFQQTRQIIDSLVSDYIEITNVVFTNTVGSDVISCEYYVNLLSCCHCDECMPPVPHVRRVLESQIQWEPLPSKCLSRRES